MASVRPAARPLFGSLRREWGSLWPKVAVECARGDQAWGSANARLGSRSRPNLAMCPLPGGRAQFGLVPVFGGGPGLAWDPCSMRLGPLRVPHLGSAWGPTGVRGAPASPRARSGDDSTPSPGVNLGVSRGRCSVGLGPLWGLIWRWPGVDLGVVRGRFGINSGSIWRRRMHSLSFGVFSWRHGHTNVMGTRFFRGGGRFRIPNFERPGYGHTFLAKELKATSRISISAARRSAQNPGSISSEPEIGLSWSRSRAPSWGCGVISHGSMSALSMSSRRSHICEAAATILPAWHAMGAAAKRHLRARRSMVCPGCPKRPAPAAGGVPKTIDNATKPFDEPSGRQAGRPVTMVRSSKKGTTHCRGAFPKTTNTIFHGNPPVHLWVRRSSLEAGSNCWR